MKKVLLSLTIMVLFFGLNALAQDDDYDRDIVEINFFGGMGIPVGEVTDWNDSLGMKNGFEIGIEVGYFVTDKFTAGFNFMFSQYSIDAAENDLAAANLKHRLYNPSLFLKYYLLAESNWAPYIKVHAGLDNPKFTTFVINPAENRYRQISYDPAFAFGIGAGLFYYTSDYSGLFIEGNYHFAASSDIEASYLGNKYLFRNNLTIIDIHAGIRILIGSGD
ncbi:MAG: hypothetical protein ACE5D6_06890 [Candidatus Zixiibacteriota bacterium]